MQTQPEGDSNPDWLKDKTPAELLGVTADDTDDFEAMTNTVYLAAQLQVASGDMGSGIQDLFNKSAKYYYGIQSIGSDDKRMYNKNTSLMDKTRFSTENATKELDKPEQVDIENIGKLKEGVQELLDMGSPKRDDTKTLFEKLQIAEKGMVPMGTGARVVLMAKYSKNGDNVSAFGKLLFIKKTDTSSLKLVIKENKIMMGTGAGSKITMNSLLQTLFDTKTDFTFEENPLDDSAQTTGQTSGQTTGTAPARRQPVVWNISPEDSSGADELPSYMLPSEPNTSYSGSKSNTPYSGLSQGGKSTRRKRKGSRKKGSSKKPVSHKKRKSGASKKRRSHPKKK